MVIYVACWATIQYYVIYFAQIILVFTFNKISYAYPIPFVYEKNDT